MYICFGVISADEEVSYASRIYLCLWFRFMAWEPFFFYYYYLCPLSRSVPLRFYVNFSYQPFSLWGLAVLCEWSDGHSSLCLSLARTHIDTRSHTQRAVTDVWMECVRGARAAEVGWCRLGVKWGGCADQARVVLQRTISISLVEQVYCPSRRN